MLPSVDVVRGDSGWARAPAEAGARTGKQLQVELAVPGAVQEGTPLGVGVVKHRSVRVLGVANRDSAALGEDRDLYAGAVAAGGGFPPGQSVGLVIR